MCLAQIEKKNFTKYGFSLIKQVLYKFSPKLFKSHPILHQFRNFRMTFCSKIILIASELFLPHTVVDSKARYTLPNFFFLSQRFFAYRRFCVEQLVATLLLNPYFYLILAFSFYLNVRRHVFFCHNLQKSLCPTKKTELYKFLQFI